MLALNSLRVNQLSSSSRYFVAISKFCRKVFRKYLCFLKVPRLMEFMIDLAEILKLCHVGSNNTN
jgi:hypothetical protein